MFTKSSRSISSNNPKHKSNVLETVSVPIIMKIICRINTLFDCLIFDGVHLAINTSCETNPRFHDTILAHYQRRYSAAYI